MPFSSNSVHFPPIFANFSVSVPLFFVLPFSLTSAASPLLLLVHAELESATAAVLARRVDLCREFGW